MIRVSADKTAEITGVTETLPHRPCGPPVLTQCSSFPSHFGQATHDVIDGV